jgi:hypothetical protein
MRSPVLILLLAAISLSFTPDPESSIEAIKLHNGGNPLYVYYINGEDGNKVLEKLLERVGKKHKANAHYNIRHLSVPGISETLKLSVNDGVRIIEDECHSGFRTFTSNKRRVEIMSKMTANDSRAILIYVNENSLKYTPAINTEIEHEAMQAFLESLINSD